MGLNQIYKLLQSKGNHKWNERISYRLKDNIYKLCDWQGLNFQNIQKLIQLNNSKKKPNNLIEKWEET